MTLYIPSTLYASIANRLSDQSNHNRYSQSYEELNNYFRDNPPANPTTDDLNVIRWLQVAEQVNSGADTFESVLIRETNATAEEFVNGIIIDPFGLEEQASSNAIASAFLRIS